jgi:hypothetical protein
MLLVLRLSGPIVDETVTAPYLRLSGCSGACWSIFNSLPLKAGIRRLNKSNSSTPAGFWAELL